MGEPMGAVLPPEEVKGNMTSFYLEVLLAAILAGDRAGSTGTS